MRVAELAAAAGVAPDTVRYYERTGLLAPPPRTPGGYRSFPESAVERLRFIQGCQRLGLRLKDIAALLTLRDTGECPCEPAEALLRRRIAEIDEETTRLANLRADLVHMVDSVPDGPCLDPEPGNWCAPREEVTT
jgi:DNA-binding transcriptional MerR regulator